MQDVIADTIDRLFGDACAAVMNVWKELGGGDAPAFHRAFGLSCSNVAYILTKYFFLEREEVRCARA